MNTDLYYWQETWLALLYFSVRSAATEYLPTGTSVRSFSYTLIIRTWHAASCFSIPLSCLESASGRCGSYWKFREANLFEERDSVGLGRSFYPPKLCEARGKRGSRNWAIRRLVPCKPRATEKSRKEQRDSYKRSVRVSPRNSPRRGSEILTTANRGG